MKNQKGITLIALIITIIVMLILVGVSVSTAINTGLFRTASGVSQNTQAERNNELLMSDGQANLDGTYTDIEEYVQGFKEVYTSCVGYYVDVNGDGTPDGIIYADLAIGSEGEKTWGKIVDYANSHEVTYSYGPTTSGLKKYSISEETYSLGGFEEKPMVTVDEGQEGKKARFHVMALNDSGFYPWYGEGIEIWGADITTSENFGMGRKNTEDMIQYWKNDSADESLKCAQMWANIESKLNEGWFIPSTQEWVECVLNLKMDTMSQFEGLEYWTSSQTANSSYNPAYIMLSGEDDGLSNIASDCSRSVRWHAAY